MRSSKSAIAISPSGVAKNDDALLTSPSRRPNVCSVCSTMDGSFAVSSRSAWISATELARAWFSSAGQEPRLAGGLPVVEHQVRAGGVQPAADRRTDPLAATGDQHDFSLHRGLRR